MKIKFIILLSFFFFDTGLIAESNDNDQASKESVLSILCPTDFEIECGWEWGQYDEYGNLVSTNTGAAFAGAKQVEAEINDQTNGCGVGVIEVEWCTIGYPVCCTQEITITEAASPWDPNNINFQNDISLGCADEIPSAVKPQWGEGLCDLVAWTSEDLELYFEEDACFKVIRTYTVVNWCSDETVTHNTYLTLFDEVPPMVPCEDQLFGILEGCSTEVSLSKSAIDGESNCSSAWLEWKAEVDLWGDGTIDYTWSFAEGADEGFNEDRDSDEDNIFYLPKTLDVSISIPEQIDNSCNNHRVTWTVNDGCNNFTSCSETFMVADQKPPTPYCISVSTAVMASGLVELWASDFDLGATDNCTDSEDLLFSFSGTEYIPNQVFSCNDDTDGDGIVHIPVYVWDNVCTPNNDFCNVALTLSNCGAGGIPISGRIATEQGEELADVNVTIDSEDVINYPMTYQTDDQGLYSFSGNAATLNYNLNVSREDDYMNGVSTLDLILLIKHIIGQQLLDTPYKMIAGDINNSGHISALDLVDLRKLILGAYEELPSNDSWRFISADQHLSLENPWIFIEGLATTNLTMTLTNTDFIGVKTGDLNGSATVNSINVSAENRSASFLSLEIESKKVVVGEQIQIDVMSSNYTDVHGFQLAMNFEGLRILDIVGGELEVSQENVIHSDQEVSMTYASQQLKSVIPSAVLFTIQVEALQAGSLKDMVHIDNNVVKGEAYYTENLEIADVQLGVIANGTLEIEDEYKLFQNEPNPFREGTQIGFTLPAAGFATLSVYNVSGKIIKQVKNDFVKGYNVIELSKTDFGGNAKVLYYQLESGDFSATRKMVLVE